MSRLLPIGNAEPAEPILLEGESVTVGRGPENRIVLGGPRVSRLHCTFHRMPGGGFKLVDAGSRNGTLVNGEQIAQKVLRPGDRIDVGGHLFAFGTGAVARPLVTRVAPQPTRSSESTPALGPAAPERAPRSRTGRVAVTAASIAALVLVGTVVSLVVVGGGDRRRRDAATGAEPLATVAPATAPELERAVARPIDAQAPSRAETAPAPPPGTEPPSGRPPAAAAVARAEAAEGAAAPPGVTDAAPEPTATGPEPPVVDSAPALSADEARARLALVSDHLRGFRFAEARSVLDSLVGAGSDDDSVEDAIEVAVAAADALRVTHARLVARLAAPDSSGLRRSIKGLGAVLGATADALLLENGERPWRDLPAERYEELVLATSPGAESLLGLAYFSFARGRDDAAHRALESALEMEPGLGGEGQRLLAHELDESVPPAGFVVHEHRFMTPERRDALVAEWRVRELFADVAGRDASSALAAAAAIPKMGDSHARRLEALLHDRLRIAADSLRKDALTKRLAPLAEDKRAIAAQREKALAIILDEQRYPFPFEGDGVAKEVRTRYEKSQREIDKETAALEKLWDEAEANTVTLTSDFRERADALSLVCDLFAASQVDAPVLPADVAFAAFLPEGEKKTSARTLFSNAAERADWLHNAKTMAANDTAPSSMTEVERTQLRITNEYRILFGRRALDLDEKLLLAARGHCQEMFRCGYFAHDGATEETRTLALRLRARGYQGSHMGENIAKARSPLMAHELWTRSSGHHRNILNSRWSLVGSANTGDLYTQNFGTND